jgi:fatty acid desaturase
LQPHTRMSKTSTSESTVPQANGKNRRITDVFSQAEIAELTQRSNAKGAWALASNWLAIIGCFTAMALYPHPLVLLTGTLLIAGRQLGLAILQHEGAHGTLFKSRWANEVLVDWLCARPVWQNVRKYRTHHIQHHIHTGSDQDPDISLHKDFPISRQSLLRKFGRDVSGYTGVKAIVGLIMMDMELIRWTVANEVVRLPQAGRSLAVRLAALVRNSAGVIITNLVLFSLLWAAGHAWLYAFWVIAFISPLQLFLRIRSIAEHGCMQRSSNTLQNTRTTLANWIARVTVAPHHVNFHAEHHLMASVPCYRLPRMHEMLMQKDLLRPAGGYGEVLAVATRR